MPGWLPTIAVARSTPSHGDGMRVSGPGLTVEAVLSTIQRILAIDWSGDLRAAHRKIWLCEVAGGEVRRLENGRSREEIAEHLVGQAQRDPHRCRE